MMLVRAGVAREAAARNPGEAHHLSDRGSHEDTLLHGAADEGSEKMVRRLLAAGADVAARDFFDRTPLVIVAAAEGGSVEVVRMLLGAGADPAAKDSRKMTALHWAALLDRDAVAQVLLNAGADASASDIGKDTPLHIACDRGFEKVVSLLLDANADMAAGNSDDDTPLQCAAAGGHQNVVRMLLVAAEQARSVAFAMGNQERLGAASLVRGLEPGVLRMVLDRA